MYRSEHHSQISHSQAGRQVDVTTRSNNHTDTLSHLSTCMSTQMTSAILVAQTTALEQYTPCTRADINTIIFWLK